MKLPLSRLLLAIALLLAACGNKKKENSQQTTATEATATDDAVLAPNFYKRLEGTIAGQPVIAHLQCTDGNLQGMYYYLKHGTWLILGGTRDTAQPNNLIINESNFSEGETIGILDCHYAQGSLKGNWRSVDGSKNYLIDLKETYPEGSYTFTSLSLNDSLTAFAQSDSSPQYRIFNTFVVPLKDDATGHWLEGAIKKALHIDSSLLSLDLVAAMRKMNGKDLKSYREEAKNMDKEEAHSSLMNYEDLQYVTICYNENGFVILNSDVYSYSGGAHGNGGSSFYCLDVRNKKELKLKDVITADSARLQPIVEAAFRRQQGLKPTDSLNTVLFENHLATTANFYFTSKGIGFYYFPYEVAAYAFGPIHVFVPFSDLKGYLKPDFTARMGLK